MTLLMSSQWFLRLMDYFKSVVKKNLIYGMLSCLGVVNTLL